jgi:hypothetical protein
VNTQPLSNQALQGFYLDPGPQQLDFDRLPQTWGDVTAWSVFGQWRFSFCIAAG